MPATSEPTPILPGLSPIGGKAIEARFDAALMSSDGGLLALREIERRLGIADRLAACIRDPRSIWRVAQFDTFRLRLIKLAARVEVLKRRVRVHLPRATPEQAIFAWALNRLPRLIA